MRKEAVCRPLILRGLSWPDIPEQQGGSSLRLQGVVSIAQRVNYVLLMEGGYPLEGGGPCQLETGDLSVEESGSQQSGSPGDPCSACGVPPAVSGTHGGCPRPVLREASAASGTFDRG